MRWERIAAWLVGLASAACTSHRPPPSSAAKHMQTSLSRGVHRVVLSNGLEVVLQEDHHAPFVAVDVRYRVGSRDDPPNRSGFAHLFEHLTFGETKHVKSGVKEKLIEAGAFGVNATTGRDGTIYFETVPSSELERVLWLESDRMAFLEIDEESIVRARKIVHNERRQNKENEPYGMVDILRDEVLFPPGHPYHAPTIGSESEIEGMTAPEAESFYATYYTPDDATLTLVGDFEEAQALAWVKKYFGDILPRSVPLDRWEPVPVVVDRERELGIVADVAAPMISFAWPAPAMRDERFVDTWVAQTVAEIAGSELWLTKKTRLRDVATGASLHFSSFELGGEVVLSVSMRKGQDVLAAKSLVDEYLRAIADRDPSESEVDVGRVVARSAIVFDLDSTDKRARMFSIWNDAVADPIYLGRTVLDRIETQGVDVRETLRDLLLTKPRVVTYVLPSPEAPRAGRIAWIK